MHLTVDGRGAPMSHMTDLDFVYRFLDEFPESVGMTKITHPHVLRYVGAQTEDWGLSGFVIIAESHISVHTFPERSYVNIDVFSCKNFDTDRAAKEIKRIFGFVSIETHRLERGIDYPHNVEQSKRLVQAERGQLAHTGKAK